MVGLDSKVEQMVGEEISWSDFDAKGSNLGCAERSVDTHNPNELQCTVRDSFKMGPRYPCSLDSLNNYIYWVCQDWLARPTKLLLNEKIPPFGRNTTLQI